MRWIKPAAGIAVTAVFVVLILQHAEWSRLLALWSATSGSVLALAILMLGVDFSIRIVRWALMIRAINGELRVAAACWPFMVGIALNNVLPFRVGDLTRVFAFRRSLGVEPVQLAGTLLVERLLDALALLLFFFVGVSAIEPTALPDSVYAGAVLLAIAGVIGVVMLFVAPNWFRQLSSLVFAFRGMNRPALLRVRDLLDRLLSSLELIIKPKLTAQLMALSVLCWACEGTVFWLVVKSLGLDVPDVAAWFSMALGTLATLIPSTPGYLGTFDYFVMMGLVAYGLEEAAAVAFGLLIHLVIWLPPTVLGGLYFLGSTAPIIRPKPSTEEGVS